MNLTTLHSSTFTQTPVYKPRVLIPVQVYSDILTLVHNYSSEIGWTGYVEKTNPNTYTITKILVYPQLVTGVTVQDDHDAYAAWVGQIPLDNLNSLRLYGHSHVNMGVTPSGTDHAQFKTYQDQTDNFYIMMIVNKKNEFRIDIFDKEKNINYVGCEYLISYSENKELLMEAAQLVKKQTPVYASPYYGNQYWGRGKRAADKWGGYYLDDLDEELISPYEKDFMSEKELKEQEAFQQRQITKARKWGRYYGKGK